MQANHCDTFSTVHKRPIVITSALAEYEFAANIHSEVQIIFDTIRTSQQSRRDSFIQLGQCHYATAPCDIRSQLLIVLVRRFKVARYRIVPTTNTLTKQHTTTSNSSSVLNHLTEICRVCYHTKMMHQQDK